MAEQEYRWLTAQEFADRCGVTRHAVFMWIKKGLIPGARKSVKGGKWLIPSWAQPPKDGRRTLGKGEEEARKAAEKVGLTLLPDPDHDRIGILCEADVVGQVRRWEQVLPWLGGWLAAWRYMKLIRSRIGRKK